MLPSLNIWKNKTVFLHPDVNVVPSTLPETFVLPYHDCIPLPKSPKAGVVICVYANDYIAGFLKGGNLYEQGLVLQVGEYLKRFPELVFVDIGSNIGMYTLFVAALGRKVLAVEMLPRNIQHTQVALRISGLGLDVALVNNALYFDHRVISVEIEKNNVGGSELEVPKFQTDTEKVDVHSVCMDDLVPLLEGTVAYMKMDIEISEHYALRGAHIFFQKVNVSVVQMEFLQRQGKNSSAEIINFMFSKGFVLSKTVDQYTPVDGKTAVGDFFFIRKEKALKKN